MKKIALLLAGWCLALQASAQEISFEHGDLASVTAKAKASGKLIFIDVYTIWCGPCKRMSQTVFTQPMVGSYFNNQFINYKIDAERGEGIALAKKYDVRFYPTYLFIDAEGNLYGKAIGYKPDTAFLAATKAVVANFNDPNNISRLLADYEKRKNDPSFLRLLIDKQVTNELSPTKTIEQYLAVQTDMPETSPQMLSFLTSHWRELILAGKADQLLNTHMATYRGMADSNQLKLLNDGGLARMLRTGRYAREEKNETAMKAFIRAWEKQSLQQQGSQTKESLWLEYYSAASDWANFKKYCNQWLDSTSRRYADLPTPAVKMVYGQTQTAGSSLSSLGSVITITRVAGDSGKKVAVRQPMQFDPVKIMESNKQKGTAYLLFLNAKKYHEQFVGDQETLNKCLYWTDRAMALNDSHYQIQNSYANLLYLKGDRDKAIRWKKSAIKLAGPNSSYKPALEANLAHMEKGEKLEGE